MEDRSQQIENLFDKVETLIVKYSKVKDENRRLNQENKNLKNQKQERDETIRTLDHKIGVLKTAGVAVNLETDSAAIKQKVNEYIREIDRCIAMLNS